MSKMMCARLLPYNPNAQQFRKQYMLGSKTFREGEEFVLVQEPIANYLKGIRSLDDGGPKTRNTSPFCFEVISPEEKRRRDELELAASMPVPVEDLERSSVTARDLPTALTDRTPAGGAVIPASKAQLAAEAIKQEELGAGEVPSEAMSGSTKDDSNEDAVVAKAAEAAVAKKASRKEMPPAPSRRRRRGSA